MKKMTSMVSVKSNILQGGVPYLEEIQYLKTDDITKSLPIQVKIWLLKITLLHVFQGNLSQARVVYGCQEMKR